MQDDLFRLSVCLLSRCGVLTGPLTSAMANKLGMREVTIIGSVIASAFFVISSFSINIDMMLVTYGIMGGMYSVHFPYYIMQPSYRNAQYATSRRVASAVCIGLKATSCINAFCLSVCLHVTQELKISAS